MRVATLLASTMILALAVGSAARAADAGAPLPAPLMPAVDGINGKLEGFGGWVPSNQWAPGSTAAGGAFGSITVPVGTRFGFQVDGMAAGVRGAFMGGVAGHFFWRDPAVGLIGVYGSASQWSRFGGVNVYRIGVEGELYLGRFSIAGVVGYETGNQQVNQGLIGPPLNGFDTFGTRSRFFDMIDVSYFVTDNWKVSVGHRYVGGRHAAAFGTEAMLPISGPTSVSAFAEGRIGERDYRGLMAGIRVYFGQRDKTLIRRSREDDPGNWLNENLFSVPSSRTTVPSGPPPMPL